MCGHSIVQRLGNRVLNLCHVRGNGTKQRCVEQTCNSLVDRHNLLRTPCLRMKVPICNNEFTTHCEALQLSLKPTSGMMHSKRVN
mmetsp:Transcript_17633/g.24765  ORF Transcript_17633/g.24765 Transcript_17633/m.24765 type:complete len:85 (+) Transcript_17633:443-697(+)